LSIEPARYQFNRLGKKPLDSFYGNARLTKMIANLSIKGQMVIPEAIREQARLKTGDKLDVGYANGLIVLRKRQLMTPSRLRALLLAGRELPKLKPADEAAVARVVRRVRGRRRA
jgi:AbrB family looped-hinge helix DNA binding protein